ncbi:MAG: condensation domain-containing protein [Bacillota bacterium]
MENRQNLNNDIAVIGIAVKLPGVNSVSEFWNALKEGRDFIGEIPVNRRVDVEQYLNFIGKDIDKTSYEVGAYLDNIDYFDNEFFNIPPNDAQYMDPNQRLFLESAWQVIEDAGYTKEKIKGTSTGVYAGYVSESDYRNMIHEVNPSFISIAVPGNCPPIITGRISHMLDLTGPNMLINTVCSSSLVAVHMACEAIRNQECDYAIAGGIQLHILPFRKVKVGVESSNGRTRSFDDDSDGTGSGEGVGLVFLKPLHKALEDKDNIYGVVKGNAVNHDGSSIGISAPNPVAQEKVIIKAWEKAGVQIEQISYIEAHGTGTKLGDPIEIAALNKAFSQYTDKKQFCAIGSVKSNLGHLDGAAGIIGFIKAVLCLHNKMLVPTINFKRPNRHIDFCNSAIYISNKLCEWNIDRGKRVCGVSSFGFSGTNCHIVIEEAPQFNRSYFEDKIPLVFTISAKNIATLKSITKLYIDYLGDNRSLNFEDVCFTSNVGRNHYKYRFATIAYNMEQLISNLKAYYFGELTAVDIVNNSMRELSNEFINKRAALLDFLDGKNVEWKNFYQNVACKKVNLVPYPFEKKRHWITIPQIKNKIALKKNEDAAENLHEENIPSNDLLDRDSLEGIIVGLIKAVLGYDQIDLSSSFFQLGGDSIHAMNIVTEINEKLDISIKLVQIIEEKSIKQLIDNIAFTYYSKRKKEDSVKLESSQYYPMAYQQKRIFFNSKMNNNSLSYNMPYAAIIKGKLDIEKLKKALFQLTQRHETLRTTFHMIKNEPMQKVNQEVILDFEMSISEDGNIDSLIKDFIQPFDLAKQPPIRYRLVKLAKDKYLFVIDVHHIISDGVSTNIIIKEFSDLYMGTPLTDLALQYKEYVAIQNNPERINRMEKYWLDMFSSKCSTTKLPYDHSCELHKGDYSSSIVTKNIDAALLKKIDAFARKNNISMFEILFSCYNILIHKYCYCEDIVIGLNVSGREDASTWNIIGLISNVVPFRNFVNPEKAIFEILFDVKAKLLGIYENQSYPIELLAEKTGTFLGSLLNLTFNMIYIEVPKLYFADLEFTPYYMKNRVMQNDIVWDIYRAPSEVLINVNYRSGLYKNDTVYGLVEDYIFILEKIVSESNMLVKELKLIPQKIVDDIDLPDTEFSF